MKKNDSLVREYVQRLSDEDLTFLSTRFSQRLSGDMAQVSDYLSRNKEMDKWLGSAKNISEWYEMYDAVAAGVNKEITKRADASVA